MCMICLQVAPQSSDCPYTSTTNAASTTNTIATASAAREAYTIEQIVEQLTTTYWAKSAQPAHSWDLSKTNVITVNLEALSADSRWFAERAFSAWTAVSGIEFQVVTRGGQISVTDQKQGAFANTVYGSDGTISSGVVNVNSSWLSGEQGEINSYALQTYIHEIGHALGLGHAGAYDTSNSGRVTYANNAEYANDSWQMTVMSYFSQAEATEVDASHAYVLTPMMADIAAIQTLYNTGGVLRTGDTTYGNGSNAGDYYDLLAQGYANMAFTIVDDGGIDQINVSGSDENQLVSLIDGTFSSVFGEVGNLGIAVGTVIEQAYTGKGNDVVIGNSVGNFIFTDAGDDQIDGGAGDDEIYASAGNDIVAGGTGNDMLRGGTGDDTLRGGIGNDDIRGGAGDDKIYGQEDNDILSGQDGMDEIDGGAGDDKLYGGAGNDTIYGAAGNDLMRGNDDDDTLYGGDGQDSVFGGDGKDSIFGDAGDDMLFGDAGDDVINGGAGNDEIYGGADNDKIYGGAGDDKLYGNRHEDILHGGAGDDMLWGGNGIDIFVFERGDDNDIIYDFVDGFEQVDLSSWGFSSVDEVIGLASTVGTDIKLDFGNGDTLTLVNFGLDQLDGSDFILS